MAISTTPTHEKTWQYVINDSSFGAMSSTITWDINTSYKRLHLRLIAGFTGFALNPWVIESSCDSTAVENNTGTNLCVVEDDIVTAVGAHSWYVYRNPVTGVQLCFDLSNANFSSLTMAWSPAAGFGATNGGVDGTTTARPTATDQIIVVNNTFWSGYLTTGVQPSALTMWHSTDGECTRIMMTADNAANAYSGLIALIETPKDPHPGWGPAQFIYWNDNANAGNIASILTTATDLGHFRETTIGAARMRIGMPWYQNLRGGNPIDGAIPMGGLCLHSSETSYIGVWGSLYDLYALPEVTNAVWGAGTYLVDPQNNPLWVSIDSLWFPWTSLEPLDFITGSS